MLTLPANSIGITDFPSITDFIEKWAQLYHGQAPRKWLSLQQELRRLRILDSLDEVALHEWNLAWAKEYETQRTCARNYYYGPLNIIYAVRDFCQPFINDQTRVVQTWMTFFDALPCESSIWEYAIADLYTEEVVLSCTLRLLFNEDTGYVHGQPTHPSWEGAMRALAGNHFTLLHQTHPNERLADFVISEGWWIIEQLYGKTATETMQHCGFLPWEGFAVMPRQSEAPVSIDNVAFD